LEVLLTGKTKLRIIIPLLQVIILLLVCSLEPLLGGHYVGRSDLWIAYIKTPEHLLLKLNFPLAVVGLPLLYLAAVAFQNVPPTGALNLVIFGAFALVILASTAAFWYLVVVEVEMRKRNSSCLRFSGRYLEKLKAIVLILIGIGAAICAVWDGHRLLVFAQIHVHNFFWSAVTDALIGGLFLFAWAAALIAMGVQDLARVLPSKLSVDTIKHKQ
jgi:hypothetical protein